MLSGIVLLFTAVLVKRGVAGVEIFGVEALLRHPQGVGKALIVNYLTLTQELDNVVHVGIVRKPQNVVIGRASLLLCYYHVFATKLSLAKARKILMFQGISALLKLTIFQKFQ